MHRCRCSRRLCYWGNWGGSSLAESIVGGNPAGSRPNRPARKRRSTWASAVLSPRQSNRRGWSARWSSSATDAANRPDRLWRGRPQCRKPIPRWRQRPAKWQTIGRKTVGYRLADSTRRAHLSNKLSLELWNVLLTAINNDGDSLIAP